jgi:L-threonylcarbamoyladenylate synthase
MSVEGLLSSVEAARCLHDGGVIAYPTEAVFGLGCDPHNEQAVRRILHLKDRPASAGLILIGADYEHFRPFIGDVSDDLRGRAMAAWPGPVTWLFPRAAAVPDWLAGRHPTIALRLTAHPVCRQICTAFGGAIVSTSANPGGSDPARSAEQVRAYFQDSLCGIVAGELGQQDNPSEIRDLASGRVLRES